MSDIYNIIAALCSYLIGSCEDDTLFVNYSCISKRAGEEILKEIYNHLPILFINESEISGDVYGVRQLRKEDFDMVFFDELEQYIARLQAQENYFALMRLVQVLDEGMKTLLLDKITAYQTDTFSVVLNTNHETTGIGLLPRCSCVWERKHWLSHSYNRMDNFLFNFLLLENSILEELIDKHFFLSNDLFSDFAQNKRIKIAASPLRLEPDFSVELYEEKQVEYFRISYNTSDYTKDNESVWQKIQKAAAQKADIIVFPEMLGNPKMTGYITNKLHSLSDVEQQTMPSLIILPSLWDKQMNAVTILDKRGNILCRQSKQNPFRAEQGEQGFLEGIKSNKVVNIFHYEGIGRIAVLICKDFLTTKYMEQLMRCFKLTLIIVPSFSTGSYDFRQSFDLCAHDDCNVIWINTCAALEKGKEANFECIGYVRKRIGRNDDDSQKLCRMPICEGAFRGNCSHDCIYFETIKGV